MVTKVLPEQKSHSQGIRLPVQSFDRFADAKNVFERDRGIEEKRVPVGESVARFKRSGGFVRLAADQSKFVLKAEFETVEKPDIDLLNKIVRGLAAPRKITFPDISDKHFVGR